MKPNLKFSTVFILTVFAVTAMLSCDKNSSIETPSEKTGMAVHACCSEDLIHYEPKDATDNDYGNIEYWRCKKCGSSFFDSNCSNKMFGSPFFLPLRYTYLRKTFTEVDKSMSFEAEINAQEGTKATNGTKAGAIDPTWFNIVLDYSTRITDLVKNISGYVDYTEGYDGFGGRKQLLEDMSDIMESIEISAEVIDDKMEQISDLVSNIYYDVPELVNYSNAINDRYRSLCDLNGETVIVLMTMDKLQDRYSSPMSAADSTELESLWKAAIMDWGNYDNGVYLQMTEDLLYKYIHPMTTHAELNFPGILKTFVDYYTLVEEDGYAFRGLNLSYDFAMTTGAYLLYSLYYHYADVEDPLYKKNKLDYINDLRDSYLKALYLDFEQRYYNHMNYYCLHTEVDGEEYFKCFSKTPQILDMTSFMAAADSENRVWDFSNDNSICPYRQIAKDFFSENGIDSKSTITTHDLDLINTYFNEGGKQNKSLRDILEQDIGITGIPGRDLMLYCYKNVCESTYRRYRYPDNWETKCFGNLVSYAWNLEYYEKLGVKIDSSGRTDYTGLEFFIDVYGNDGSISEYEMFFRVISGLDGTYGYDQVQCRPNDGRNDCGVPEELNGKFWTIPCISGK